MAHYCGIDLHSTNHVVVVINEEDERMFEKRLGNDLSQTLKALAPFKSDLISPLLNLPSTSIGLSMD